MSIEHLNSVLVPPLAPIEVGHPCAKTMMVVSEPNHPTEKATLWCASDLQQFPIKMEVNAEGRIMKFDFRDVQVKKPDASLFEIPTNYVEFTNSTEILNYAKEKFRERLNTVPK